MCKEKCYSMMTCVICNCTCMWVVGTLCDYVFLGLWMSAPTLLKESLQRHQFKDRVSQQPRGSVAPQKMTSTPLTNVTRGGRSIYIPRSGWLSADQSACKQIESTFFAFPQLPPMDANCNLFLGGGGSVSLSPCINRTLIQSAFSGLRRKYGKCWYKHRHKTELTLRSIKYEAQA